LVANILDAQFDQFEYFAHRPSSERSAGLLPVTFGFPKWPALATSFISQRTNLCPSPHPIFESNPLAARAYVSVVTPFFHACSTRAAPPSPAKWANINSAARWISGS